MATARQLEIFLSVVENGGMRQAADALGISQPSISRQLRALERSVGGELFLRKLGAKARVSPLGADLLRDARDTLEHHRRLKRGSEPEADDLRVIFVRSFLLGQIKNQISSLYERGLSRDARFTVVDDHSDIASLVEAERGSIGIFRTDALPNDERVTSVILRLDTGSLYCAPELAERLAIQGNRKGAGVGIADIDILFPDQLLGLKAYTVRLLKHAKINCTNVRPGSQFIELLLKDVLNGAGAAVFFDETVKDLVAERKLVRLLDVGEPYYLVLVAHKSVGRSAISLLSKMFAAV